MARGGQKSRKALKNGENNVEQNSKSNGRNENTSKAKSRTLKKRRRNRKNRKNTQPQHDNSDVFALQDIANNREASTLIFDLLKCFTSNTTLPQEEVDILNRTLFKKTVRVFVHVLNNCVEKIFNKLLNTGYLKDLVGEKAVKNAFCQTDISMHAMRKTVNDIQINSN